ncbi:hypothetical protein BJV82DRAFT_577390 [Fennellomyces sp. T-0311]|nr:hypothetical protein BJV82DRAFT_577390 [Fennellomyces sp. T-0311]
MKFSGKSGYQAIDTHDPETEGAPPPPYSPTLREEVASAPPSSDFGKDYEQYDRTKPITVTDGQPSNSGKHYATIYPSPPRNYGNFIQATPQRRCGRRNGKPCYIRTFMNKAKQANKKVILLGFLGGAALALFFTRILIPSAWSELNHCVRDGSATWDALPSSIPFDKDVNVVIRGHVSAGVVTIVPLPETDPSGGSINTRATVYPGEYIDSRFHYSLDHVNDETRLIIQVPEDDIYYGRSCVYLEMEIRLPANASRIYVSASNMGIRTDGNDLFRTDQVELKTTNARIHLPLGWQGKKIRLTSKNAALEFYGEHSLHAVESIDLETTNGAIRLDSADTRQGAIRLASSNGHIRSHGTHAATLLEASSSNGRIDLQDVSSHDMVARTSNGVINLQRVNAEESLTAQSSNGRIHAEVEGSPRVKAAFTTSNSRIRVSMPPYFIGPFRVSTSSAKIRVTGSDITMENDGPNEKIGYKTSKYGDGSVTIHTTNARVRLSL